MWMGGTDYNARRLRCGTRICKGLIRDSEFGIRQNWDTVKVVIVDDYSGFMTCVYSTSTGTKYLRKSRAYRSYSKKNKNKF